MSFAKRTLAAVCPPDHEYRLAVYPELVDLDAYSPTGEWVGHGYRAGGIKLDGYRIEMDGDEAVLRFNKAEWVDADIRVRTALIYDATTGFAVNLTQLNKVVGVIGGLFEYKMPDKGVARVK